VELNIRLDVGRRGDARSGALGARLGKAIAGARLGACDQDRVFSVHDGVKDALQGAEINALSGALAEQGRGTLTAPGSHRP
jgi:hypothetical protein